MAWCAESLEVQTSPICTQTALANINTKPAKSGQTNQIMMIVVMHVSHIYLGPAKLHDNALGIAISAIRVNLTTKAMTLITRWKVNYDQAARYC